MTPAITDRPLAGEADAMRVRQLLIDSYTQMGREFNWEIRRWEGSYWYQTDADFYGDRTPWEQTFHLWETSGGELVGAVIPDGPGDAALQVHPDYRDLEDEMLAWAEANRPHVTENGQRRIVTWAFEWDTNRQERLARRGYTPKAEWFWHYRRRPVNLPVPDVKPAEGYTIRALRRDDFADSDHFLAASNAVFGHKHTPDMHRNFQKNSPSYNYDLHIVAEAPDGSLAAFAGLTVAAANRYGLFEPVGTHPDHRRKGLASAVMNEALRRVQALGTADVFYVANWGTADAGKLYASVGLEHYATQRAWEKFF